MKLIIFISLLMVCNAKINQLSQLLQLNNKAEGRLVGGEMCTVEQAPWQGAVKCNGDYIGGATLITTKSALTTADTVKGYIGKCFLSITLGTSYVHTALDKRVTRYVYKTECHPDYVRGNAANNLCALFFPSVKLCDSINVVKLPEMYRVKEGDVLLSSGWGSPMAHDTQVISLALRCGEFKIVPYKNCTDTYGEDVAPYDGICAEKGAIANCYHDSGSGLVNVANRCLAGIACFGSKYGCGEEPSGFTDPKLHMDWLKGLHDKSSKHSRGCSELQFC